MGSESNPVCEIGPVCGIDPVCETGPASESYKCMAVNIVMLYIYAVRHILHFKLITFKLITCSVSTML